MIDQKKNTHTLVAKIMASTGLSDIAKNAHPGVMKILLCFFSNKDGLLCFFSNKDGMKKGEGDYNQSIHNIFIAFQALYR